MQTGISLPTRTIYLLGRIDEDKFRLVHLGLDLLDKEDATTTIILSSEGGCTADGLAIYDAIQACSGQVRIIGTGAVYSMATVILQAGDERLLTKNTRVHIHESTAEYGRSSLSELDRHIGESKALDDLTWDILAFRTGLPARTLKERMSLDTYLSPTQAIELGLADSIL